MEGCNGIVVNLPAILVISHLFPVVEVMGSNLAPPFSRSLIVHAKLQCTPLSAPFKL